ncbi:hypothetical protein [Prauserella alba]|uniref:hypothetical protein n=1 Tax=Prauserella alba TaxID=176898 RepID=UPI0020A28001|nr:hypothetical protein [Prauserella alba]
MSADATKGRGEHRQPHRNDPPGDPAQQMGVLAQPGPGEHEHRHRGDREQQPGGDRGALLVGR